jgi:hypothetical protein
MISRSILVRWFCTFFAIVGVFWATFLVLYFSIVVVILAGFVIGVDMSREDGMFWTSVVFAVSAIVAFMYWRYVITRNIRMPLLIIPPILAIILTVAFLWPVIQRFVETGHWFSPFQ